ncbi:hypothetical protein NMG60_11024428 [Bertholletia excelsa]
MDKRSWPWKKKSSDKSGTEKTGSNSDSALASADPQGGQDNRKKTNYVQISLESYSHLSGLENQVKDYEKQVKTYEGQVKAYEGQVKAYEDQVKTYEDQLKTLEDEVEELNEKLSASQVEMTNKENLVKQHAKVAEDAVSGWEKAEAEALALKSHLESVTLLKLTAEDCASHLDGALKECMRQIRNLKEEHEQNLHDVVLSKTKQWEKIKLELEAKISNLDQELLRSEAESAALSRSLQERSNMLVKISEEKSQVETEVELLKSNIESCEREVSSLKYELHIINKELEIRNEEKNMSVKSAEVANKQHLEGCQRLRGLVRKKLPGPAALAQMKLEVDLGRDYGETRLRRSPVKPSNALSSTLPEFSVDNVEKFQKENELLTVRLLAMEEETKMLKEALAKRNNELQASRNLSNSHQSQKAGSPPSITSVSEDGNDDEGSCAGSWATASVSEFSHFKEKNTEKSNKSECANHMELMDDFLEMEKLANLSLNQMDSEIANTNSIEVKTDPQSEVDLLPLKDLQSKISTLFESTSKDSGLEKILDGIRCVVQETSDRLHQRSAENCSGTELTEEKEISCSEDSKQSAETVHAITKELAASISQIHDFVLFLGNEANRDGLHQKIQEFAVIYDKVINGNISLLDFVIDLSCVLNKAHELHINFGNKSSEEGTHPSDCVDKVALPENKMIQETSMERFPNGCVHFSDSASDPDIPPEGSFNPNLWKCSPEEFEQLKLEKENMGLDLARCCENLESTRSRLQETEQLLADVKSQLASSQKLNSLAETQLKCMAESYKTLETRADKLQSEVNVLRAKIESLDDELQEERRNHQDALTKCMGLEEQLQSCYSEVAMKKACERELAAAAEKLAECQETIFLLGKQLKSLRPQSESMELCCNDRSQKGDSFRKEGLTTTGMNLRDFDLTEMNRVGSESPFSSSDTEANTLSRSPISTKHPSYQPTQSGSSSSSSPTPEKHSRGFTRFFSSNSKGRYGY